MQQALRVLIVMGAEGIEFDSVTCSAAISACEKGGLWQRALLFLSSIGADYSEMYAITCNAATSAGEKGGQWQQSLGTTSPQHDGGGLHWDHWQRCDQRLREVWSVQQALRVLIVMGAEGIVSKPALATR